MRVLKCKEMRVIVPDSKVKKQIPVLSLSKIKDPRFKVL